jgi:hypothetical protein
MTRREFGASVGGWAAASALFGAQDAPWAGPATVKKVFLAVPRPTWPRPDLDVAAEKAAMEATLAQVERQHAADVRFTGGDLVRTPEDAQAFVKALGDADGVLVMDLTSGTSGLLRPFRDLPAPMLLYSRPYSGWSYETVTTWVQAGQRADVIVTSDAGNLSPYLRAFHSLHHLRRSKILAINNAGAGAVDAEFTKRFGTAFDYPKYADLKAAYDAVDVANAQRSADEFTRGALRVVEPSPREVTDSLRLYHAVLAMLEREKANAMTIDCLGGFRRGDLPAYPCVAWSKLNDAGLYGVCEGDVLSTMTQLLLTPYTGKPGFVTDPVFDTGRNEIIHAHCVAATAMDGLGGKRYPYAIRSHMEDNKGVSVQVMMPDSGAVTVGKFLNATTFAVSTGEVLGNVDDPRGCRTKVRTRVADARKMLAGYKGGLHRVLFYGDYADALEQMGPLAGFKTVREC